MSYVSGFLTLDRDLVDEPTTTSHFKLIELRSRGLKYPSEIVLEAIVCLEGHNFE